MKRVLILANSSVGLHNFRAELIEKLISCGFEVVFSLPDKIDDHRVEQLVKLGATYKYTHINRRGINPIEDMILARGYYKLIKKVNPDIVLTYTVKPNIYGSIAAHRLKKPVLMNITGIGTSLTYSKVKFIVTGLYKAACKRADTVFFQNSSNMDLFLSKELVDRKKIRLLPGSGVNTNKFKPLDNRTEGDTVVFLFIGRLMKEKGIAEYLEVAERITGLNNKAVFQILGLFNEEYNNLITRNKNNRIIYLGTSNDVRKEIGNADCIVNPSYHEGMSNVLLEAAAMGKPLIASNIPGCREIIDEGINGLLCEPGSADSLYDAIIKFLNMDGKERKHMGMKSRTKVEENFDRRIVIDSYITEIDRILEGQK